MGRGDNKRTIKTRQRKAWRKKKERLKKLIAGIAPVRPGAKASAGKGAAGAPGAAR